MDLTNLAIEIYSKKTDRLLVRDTIIKHITHCKRPYIKLERSTRKYYLDSVKIQFNLFQL